MRLIYNFGIRLYGFAVQLASFFGSSKAIKWIDGRRNWRQQLKSINKEEKPLIWFHTASLGEFEQARPLIEKIKSEKPKTFILLTFFSPSGYEVRKNYMEADFVTYLPLDTVRNATDFIQICKPTLAIFIKYEFWFNYLKILENKKISTFLVSGIFRPSQHFFKFYGSWFKKNLNAFTKFYVQNTESKSLLLSINFTNCEVIGDTRFDRVIKIAKEPFDDSIFGSLELKSKVVIFGSSWKKENDIALQFSKDFPDFKLIIAPHEIRNTEIIHLKDTFGEGCFLYSEFKPGQKFDVLIIDCIGLLSKLYRYASFSIIGGGFGNGIHNLPEAAVYGSPVFFGPNHKKFQEARDLIVNGGGFCIKNYSELKDKTAFFIENPSELKKASDTAKNYIEFNSGASQKIYIQISNQIK